MKPHKYYAKEFAPGRWHVIGPFGIPVYDSAPYGNDKPIVWTDEDKVLHFVEQCNIGEGEESE